LTSEAPIGSQWWKQQEIGFIFSQQNSAWW
jgi:hypothetical protein